MIKTLHFETNQIHAAFGQLQKQLRSVPKGTEVTIANGLWAQSGHPFVPQFLSLVQQEYDATVNQVDFHRPAAVAHDVNSWVTGKTKGKLGEIVPDGLFDDNSRLVVVNVVYFKGTWMIRFNPSQTTEWDFHLDQHRTTKCQMMHCTGKFRSGRVRECEVAELSYEGEALSMFIVLPTYWDGLADLEANLNYQNVSSWLSSVREPDEPMHMQLPKFRIESGFRLNDSLAEMGVKDAFGPDADFSGIDGTTNLFLSDVLHRAFVEVDEEGTRAGAATLSHLGTKGMAPRFCADRPFLFLIRDNRTGGILFVGRVADPTRS